MELIRTKTGSSQFDGSNLGSLSVTICSQDNCCSIPDLSHSFQIGDKFAGISIESCDQFEYDPNDVYVAVTKHGVDNWSGEYA